MRAKATLALIGGAAVLVAGSLWWAESRESPEISAQETKSSGSRQRPWWRPTGGFANAAGGLWRLRYELQLHALESGVPATAPLSIEVTGTLLLTLARGDGGDVWVRGQLAAAGVSGTAGALAIAKLEEEGPAQLEGRFEARYDADGTLWELPSTTASHASARDLYSAIACALQLRRPPALTASEWTARERSSIGHWDSRYAITRSTDSLVITRKSALAARKPGPVTEMGQATFTLCGDGQARGLFQSVHVEVHARPAPGSPAIRSWKSNLQLQKVSGSSRP